MYYIILLNYSLERTMLFYQMSWQVFELFECDRVFAAIGTVEQYLQEHCCGTS